MKKFLIGAGILILVLVALYFFAMNRNRTLSPPGMATSNSSEFNVTVNYSRPSVRERLIFGEEEEGALLPYGVYWRLGANEPTFLEVSAPFIFGDKPFDAGKYVIYAIPRKGEMELRLSSDLRLWGYTEPDYSKDLATEIVRMRPNDHTEQFTIDVTSTGERAELLFRWSNQRWELTLKKQ